MCRTLNFLCSFHLVTLLSWLQTQCNQHAPIKLYPNLPFLMSWLGFLTSIYFIHWLNQEFKHLNKYHIAKKHIIKALFMPFMDIHTIGCQLQGNIYGRRPHAIISLLLPFTPVDSVPLKLLTFTLHRFLFALCLGLMIHCIQKSTGFRENTMSKEHNVVSRWITLKYPLFQWGKFHRLHSNGFIWFS